jgi:transcription initiation factor IIE alpha subunit
MRKTQSTKLVQALEKGEELTAKQIASRFNIANPTAVIANLRSEGHVIYTNTRKNHRGETVSKYRIGKPTKRLVAAGLALLGVQGAGLVN